LHYVFDAPADKIVWDVAHQCYPHKIITGRRDRMSTLRQQGGLLGFTKMEESEYDAFGAGHSSTSISAAQGYDLAKQILGRKNHSVAIIGDGAITGGMAFEALNVSSYLKSRQIVILNDNQQVSLPTGMPSVGGTGPAGALAQYTQTLPNPTVKAIKDWARDLNNSLPSEWRELNKKIDDIATEKVFSHATLFEELGFRYVGPMNGHDLPTLVRVLEEIRDSERDRPVLLHVRTTKGKGYAPAEAAADTMHAVAPFDVVTGVQKKGPAGPPTFTKIMATEMSQIAKEDPTVVGITAAMPGGTGMDYFGAHFPDRCYDVGIAEQHAVTLAAGMAAEGVKPFCAIYSTFLQRAYDQVVHDVALQGLPVRFMVDRAGYVGNDGATHHGTFDLSYLGSIPNVVIMAPSDEVELMNMVRTAHEYDSGPSFVRYPRGAGYGLETLNNVFNYDLEEMPISGAALKIGKGRIIREGRSAERKNKVAILSIGTRLATSLLAAKQLEESDPDVSVTVADARYMKPLDRDLVRKLAKENHSIVTVEEGSIGGFGSHVLHFLALEGYLDGQVQVRPLVLPDYFMEAGTQQQQNDAAGISTGHLVTTVQRLRGDESLTDPNSPTARAALESSFVNSN
jgi:1-deoxy-D-xylulose-5-phosphate synthase